MGLNSVTGSQYLISTGQQNKHTKFLILGGGVNVIFNCLLIPKKMALGAAIASVIGEGTIAVLELSFLFKTGQYDIRSVFKNLYKYLISGIIMFAITRLLMNFVNNIIGIVIVVTIGGIVYFVSLIIFKDELITAEVNNKFLRRKAK